LAIWVAIKGRRPLNAKGKKMSKLIGSVYTYRNGQERVEFRWNGHRDGFAWSVPRQVRLAEYTRLKDLVAAFRRSDNREGPYGMSKLYLHPDD